MLKKAKEIRNKHSKIRNKLIDDPELFESLILNLIDNKLSGISVIDFEHSLRKEPGKIYQKLENLLDTYRDEMHPKKNLNDLLKEITLEALYKKVVNKEKSVLTDRLINLLCKAKIHFDKMKNKDIVIFIGSTGAGKSTTVSYLLGAKLEYVQNKIGESIVKYVDESELFPRIGQSIAISETIYAQGYEILHGRENKSILLCDCPGFHDTRGTEYELCTTLSISKAIEESRSIKGVVLIIPYSSFLVDKGQGILQTFESLIDILPSFLDGNMLWTSVSIMVSKALSYENVLTNLTE